MQRLARQVLEFDQSKHLSKKSNFNLWICQSEGTRSALMCHSWLASGFSVLYVRNLKGQLTQNSYFTHLTLTHFVALCNPFLWQLFWLRVGWHFTSNTDTIFQYFVFLLLFAFAGDSRQTAVRTRKQALTFTKCRKQEVMIFGFSLNIGLVTFNIQRLLY